MSATDTNPRRTLKICPGWASVRLTDWCQPVLCPVSVKIWCLSLVSFLSHSWVGVRLVSHVRKKKVGQPKFGVRKYFVSHRTALSVSGADSCLTKFVSVKPCPCPRDTEFFTDTGHTRPTTVCPRVSTKIWCPGKFGVLDRTQNSQFGVLTGHDPDQDTEFFVDTWTPRLWSRVVACVPLCPPSVRCP